MHRICRNDIGDQVSLVDITIQHVFLQDMIQPHNMTSAYDLYHDLMLT